MHPELVELVGPAVTAPEPGREPLTRTRGQAGRAAATAVAVTATAGVCVMVALSVLGALLWKGWVVDVPSWFLLALGVVAGVLSAHAGRECWAIFTVAEVIENGDDPGIAVRRYVD